MASLHFPAGEQQDAYKRVSQGLFGLEAVSSCPAWACGDIRG